MELASINNLILLNGRFTGDLDGNFTFISKNGKSTIDLVFTSALLARRVVSTSVVNLPISQHNGYCFVWAGQVEIEQTIHSITKLKWNTEKLNDFQEEFTLLGENVDLTKIDYNGLIECIQSAATNNGLTYTKLGNSEPSASNKKWFDRDCRQTRSLIKGLFFKGQRCRWSDEARIAHAEAKKDYVKLCRFKRRQYFTSLQNALSKSRNPSDFWKNIKPFRQRGFAVNPIDGKEWCRFYQSILPLREVDRRLFFDVTHPELDSNITIKEIQSALRKLPSNKAPGPDGVQNEFLKALPLIGIEMLETIFNNILSSSHPAFRVGSINHHNAA